MKLPSAHPAGRLYLIGVLLFHALLFWNIHSKVAQGYPDFTIYYTAGTMLRTGMSHQLYNAVAQRQVQQQFAPNVITRFGPLPFNHPPLEAVLFAPLTYFPYTAAYTLWFLLNLAMLAAVPVLLRPHIPLLRRLPVFLWFLMLLAFFPVLVALIQGQDAILLLLIYVLAFVAYRRNCLARAGAWLACALFKFHLVLPFAALLLVQQETPARGKRILLGFLPVAALLGILSLLAVGPHQIAVYPRYTLGLEAAMARRANLPADMPNLRGALYLAVPGAVHLDLAVLALSILFFPLAAWILHRSDNRSTALKFSLSLIAALLLSYHGLVYDLCTLVLAAMLLADWLTTGTAAHPISRWLMTPALALLLFSPLQAVLLMRFRHLGWLSWALIALSIGLAAELHARPRPAALP